MKIFELLQEKLNLAYSPYSNVKVVACAIDNNNNAFFGVNVENPAFPSGLCAERSCLFGSVAYGGKVKSFKEIHVASNLKNILYCCSGCLQVMTQFLEDGAKVYFYNNDGSKTDVKTINELVPYQVQDKDIKF